MASPKILSVVIADAEPASRHQLILFCNAQKRLRVGGAAGSIPEVRDLCRSLKPDLLIIDPAIGGGEGFGLICELSRFAKGTRAVVFARQTNAASIERAFRAGARGYVSRLEEEEELLKVLLTMEDGKSHLSLRASAEIADGLSNGAVCIKGDILARLSDRERQIFALLGEGLPSRDVATTCGVSLKTIESHMEHIKSKLGLRSGAELRKRAADATRA